MSKAFTLVELLVTIAVIGLLATVAVVTMGTSRTNARNAKRVADVQNIQKALEQYYVENAGYPIKTTAVQLGTAGNTTLCSSSGISGSCTGETYMSPIPVPPTPAPTGTSACTADAPAGYCYTSANGTVYSITFSLYLPFLNLGADGVDTGSVVDCTANTNGITCN